MKKILSFICAIALLFAVLSIAIEAIKYNYSFGSDHLSGTELRNWINSNFGSKEPITDSEYSFAFVGDTQYVTYADFRDGTNNLQKTYKWIADNVSSKKIAHVFALGDMTHMSYENDVSISYDQTYGSGLGEWNIVKNATDQLKGKVPFSVVRGNHDDFQIDDIYGSDSDYTSQFGGFYRERSGIYKDSITNSWRIFDIHDDKYLFITIDFNTKPEVLKWAGDIIEQHPDRKVIITTHGYLFEDGALHKAEIDSSSYKGGLSAITDKTVDGEKIWQDLASKYENVMMVCSGHVSASNIVYNFKEGDHGNQVLQVLIDPQTLDLQYAYTGLVLLMHFSEDGTKIELEYYSPLLNMHKKGNDKTIDLNYTPIKSDESISENGRIDTTDLEKYGLELNYIGKALTKSTTLNGKISEGEYSFSRTISKNDTKHISGIWQEDITEYFGYDKNYVYYAFSTKFSGTPTINLQLTAENPLMKIEDYSSYISNRTVFRLTVDSDGVGVKLKDNWGTSTWNSDAYAGATATADGTHAYEFKISRAHLKEFFGVSSTQKLGILLYTGLDEIGDEMWIRHNLSDEAIAVLKNSLEVSDVTPWMFRYIILDDNTTSPAASTLTTTTAAPTSEVITTLQPTPTTAEATEPVVETTTQTTTLLSTEQTTTVTTVSTDTQDNGCGAFLNNSVILIIPFVLSSFVLLFKKRKADKT